MRNAIVLLQSLLLLSLLAPANVAAEEVGVGEARIDVRSERSQAPSYFEAHYALVEHDLLILLPSESPALEVDTLDAPRARDRLLLLRDHPPLGVSAMIGPALFDAMVFLCAHSPVRVPFDKNVHLGPAIFDGGGMGIGVGGGWR